MHNYKKESRRLRYGRRSIDGQIYLVTVNCFQRRPIFYDGLLAKALINQLHIANASSLTKTIAYVVMPDHFHWLFELGDLEPLAKLIGRIKANTGRQIRLISPEIGNIWQKSFHDHALRSEENIQDITEYIFNNPVRAGIAREASEYPYSNVLQFLNPTSANDQ